MPLREPLGPDLPGVVADALAVGLRYVVIGGFSVIANGYVRATDDSDLLVGEDEETNAAILRFLERTEATRLSDGKKLGLEDIATHHLRLDTRHGIVDILRGGLPPLDFETVASRAFLADIGGVEAPVADLVSIVGFKRLSGRTQDKLDLEKLEAFHGELPVEPIPGVDD